MNANIQDLAYAIHRTAQLGLLGPSSPDAHFGNMHGANSICYDALQQSQHKTQARQTAALNQHADICIVNAMTIYSMQFKY